MKTISQLMLFATFYQLSSMEKVSTQSIVSTTQKVEAQVLVDCSIVTDERGNFFICLVPNATPDSIPCSFTIDQLNMFMEWENLVTLCVGSTLLFSICFISWALLKLVGRKLTESEKGSTIYKTMSFILFYSSLVSFMYLVKYVCDMAILYRKPGVKEAMAVVSELTKLYIQ